MGRNVVTPRSCKRSSTIFSCRARVCRANQFSVAGTAVGINCGLPHDSIKVAIASPSEPHDRVPQKLESDGGNNKVCGLGGKTAERRRWFDVEHSAQRFMLFLRFTNQSLKTLGTLGT